jgi:hypothetical protein
MKKDNKTRNFLVSWVTPLTEVKLCGELSDMAQDDGYFYRFIPLGEVLDSDNAGLIRKAQEPDGYKRKLIMDYDAVIWLPGSIDAYDWLRELKDEGYKGKRILVIPDNRLHMDATLEADLTIERIDRSFSRRLVGRLKDVYDRRRSETNYVGQFYKD